MDESKQIPAAGLATPFGCCAVPMQGMRPCGRSSWGAVINGNHFCLMHSPSSKDADAFQQEFERILNDAGDGVADFTGFVFPSSNYDGRQFEARCLFGRASFSGKVTFTGTTFRQKANFSYATFEDDAYFSRATFAQGVIFAGVRFKEWADFGVGNFAQEADFVTATFTWTNFKRATFVDQANFALATFTKGRPIFREATFAGKVDFWQVKFPQGASFSSATFAQEANFKETRFEQEVIFWGTTFRGSTSFNEATFEREADFRAATFEKDADFMYARFLGAALFRQTRFRKDTALIPGPVFSLATFSRPEEVSFYKTYLGQALFHNCDVSKLSFSSVEWRRRNGSGKRMVFEEDVQLECVEALQPDEGTPDQRDFRLIAELYQALKKNYDERKDYWTAGDFHYGEMEMNRLSSRRKASFARWLHRNLGLVAWYKYASQYGESYMRPALALIGVLFLFALLFPLVGLRASPEKTAQALGGSQLVDTVTYWHPFLPRESGRRLIPELRLLGNSCITALEIAAFQKDPAYLPTYPWGRFLALLEMVLTSILLALFLLAVRRQFRR